MNFLCDKCKQKYHVADEKLRGRAVTRFRCKKCDHIIELQASDLAVPGSQEPSHDAPSTGAIALSVPPASMPGRCRPASA